MASGSGVESQAASSMRALMVMTAVLIIGFAAVNVYSIGHARRLDESAAHATGRAGPNVERLAAARTILRHMSDGALRLGDREPPDRSFFTVEGSELQAELAARGEQERDAPEERELAASIDALEHDIDRGLALVERGQRREAGALVRAALVPSERRALSALEQLIAHYDAELDHAGAALRRSRQRISRIAYALTALASLAALVVLGWAVYSLRAATRADELRRRLLEERARELELFASRVAHDLKSPLAGLILLIGAAERRRPDETMALVRGELRAMARLVDGLLEFSLAGATPVPGRAEVGEVLAELLPGLRREALAAGAELVVPPVRGLAVACSGGGLASVVANLVRNAIKYSCGSAQRRVELRARAVPGGVRVEVADTGPGIPAGQEERVFEPLVRLPGAPQGGFGLGLATVKRLVQASGGRVGVEPGEGGRGSCFWFELPAAAERPPISVSA
jgi:signal transduction histidine kinase